MFLTHAAISSHFSEFRPLLRDKAFYMNDLTEHEREYVAPEEYALTDVGTFIKYLQSLYHAKMSSSNNMKLKKN
jgi:hypothetical protein